MFQYLQDSQTFARFEPRLETTAPNSKMLLTAILFFCTFCWLVRILIFEKMIECYRHFTIFLRNAQNIVYNEYNDIIN